MAALPVEILLGIYLGLLVGILPALVSWGLGFSFRYVTGLTVPAFGVMLVAIALAGVNGGLLALTEKSIIQNPNAPRIITAVIIVGMMSMYAHSKGDSMAADMPERASVSTLRERTLSLDLADVVPERDEVRIRVVGEVADMEGYPPLSAELRADLRNAELTFPVDLTIPELERRAEDRLTTEYDLGDVSVTIDERGRASVVAAPPFSGLSKRVEDGRHAVSVDGLVPTGLARNDEVTLITPNAQVRGTVVSADTGDNPEPDIEPRTTDEPAGDDTAPSPVRAPTTEGGEGRLTAAVTRTDVQPVLRSDRAKVVVESRGTRREYEVVSMLRRADQHFRRIGIRGGTELVGVTLGSLSVHDAVDVSVLAIRKGDGWHIAPDYEVALEPGDELFAVGSRADLDEFQEVAS